MNRLSVFAFWSIIFSIISLGCGAKHTTPAPTRPSKKTVSQVVGGQLYDKWTTVKAAKLPESMRDGEGALVENAKGHDFRCKSCHGWDYKGAAGIYGPNYQNKAFVASVNLVSLNKSEKELEDIIKNGAKGMPAYGSVLNADDIAALAKFLKEGVYDISPIIALDAAKQKKYVMANGANPAVGQVLYANKCSKCHGIDGTSRTFDNGAFNVGNHTRQNAYEDHHKIKFGHPGSTMGSITTDTDEIRDILAALCDTSKFPGGLSGDSVVKESDSCGPYYR